MIQNNLSNDYIAGPCRVDDQISLTHYHCSTIVIRDAHWCVFQLLKKRLSRSKNALLGEGGVQCVAGCGFGTFGMRFQARFAVLSLVLLEVVFLIKDGVNAHP